MEESTTFVHGGELTNVSGAKKEYQDKVRTMSRVLLKISWTAVELIRAVAAYSWALLKQIWGITVHSPEVDQPEAQSQGRQTHYRVSTYKGNVRP